MVIRLLSAALAAASSGRRRDGARTRAHLAADLEAEPYEAPPRAAPAPRSPLRPTRSDRAGACGARSRRARSRRRADHAEWKPQPGFSACSSPVSRPSSTGSASRCCWRGDDRGRREPSPARGLAFAVAGFLAVALAPAMGLAPELPGSEAAALAARQVWWVVTASATAIGLFLFALRRVPITIVGGIVLIVAPHLAGAPDVAASPSALPAGLAAHSPRARSPSPSCSGRRSGSVSGVPGRPSARSPRWPPMADTVLYVCTTCRLESDAPDGPEPGLACSTRCARWPVPKG